MANSGGDFSLQNWARPWVHVPAYLRELGRALKEFSEPDPAGRVDTRRTGRVWIPVRKEDWEILGPIFIDEDEQKSSRAEGRGDRDGEPRRAGERRLVREPFVEMMELGRVDLRLAGPEDAENAKTARDNWVIGILWFVMISTIVAALILAAGGPGGLMINSDLVPPGAGCSGPSVEGSSMVDISTCGVSARLGLSLYYVAVTMTTLGYGDILPSGLWPRVVADILALLGPTFGGSAGLIVANRIRKR